MIAIDAAQGTDEWKAVRVGVPSGSNFDKIMAEGSGATRAAYLTSIALEIVTGIREEIQTNYAMQQGTDREPLARAAYEARTGEIVEEIGFCLHDAIRCGVSPDGLVGKKGLTEYKCPQPKTHLEYMKRKDAPPAYKWQIQGQLWVMEREWCDFASWSCDFPLEAQLVVRRVYRDEDAIKKLESAVIKFIDDANKEAEFIRNYKEPA